MLGLIGAVLAVGISLCWYLPGIRAQGANRVLKRNDYWRTAGVYGFCYTCLLIIVTEILWDVVADRIGLTGLKRDILADFSVQHCWKNSSSSPASFWQSAP